VKKAWTTTSCFNLNEICYVDRGWWVINTWRYAMWADLWSGSNSQRSEMCENGRFQSKVYHLHLYHVTITLLANYDTPRQWCLLNRRISIYSSSLGIAVPSNIECSVFGKWNYTSWGVDWQCSIYSLALRLNVNVMCTCSSRPLTVRSCQRSLPRCCFIWRRTALALVVSRLSSPVHRKTVEKCRFEHQCLIEQTSASHPAVPAVACTWSFPIG